MKLLEERIKRDGVVKSEGVLKVDSFLNHQIDVNLIDEMGAEFARLFADAPVNKILTIEASGIGIACLVARHFGNAPVVFAKKAQSINLDGEMYSTKIQSFTHGRIFDVIVSKKFLSPEDHVLIIDDFLANGCALNGLIELVEESGASSPSWRARGPRSRASASRWRRASSTEATSCASRAITWSRSQSSNRWIPTPARSSSAKTRR